MSKPATHPRRLPVGFTLIELLVVIAIISLLAALLLPTLAQGKAAAKSAACKSNLRQLGTALSMYVGEYDKYPGSAALYSGDQFAGIWGTGLNWLNPYLGGHFNPDNSLDWYYQLSITRTVFNCPAVKPIYFQGLFGATGKTFYDLGYGYNELGTGWKDQRLQLGLGFHVQLTGYGPNGLPLGQRIYVRSANVKSPADLIGFGDGSHWLFPNRRPDAIEGIGSIISQHPNRQNMVFCDGHVESAKRNNWVEEANSARARWNNDNQAHPETW